MAEDFPDHTKAPLYKERSLRDRGSYTEITYDELSKLDVDTDEFFSTYRKVELKYDGIWGRLEVHDGEWVIYSRTGKVKDSGTCASHLDYTLIGEFIHGKHRLHKKGMFYGYDCLKYEDIYMHDYTFNYRRRYLRNAVEVLTKEEEFEWWVRQSQLWDSYQWKHLWEQHVEGEAGWEGLVFKSYSKYDDKGANIRLKRECEIDYVCIGFDMADPESKYAGQVGAVRGSLTDKPCDVKCGGLSEEARKIYTKYGHEYIGKVFTAKGNGWFPSGSVRHPKFQKWRDDKSIVDCTYEQLPVNIRRGGFVGSSEEWGLK